VSRSSSPRLPAYTALAGLALVGGLVSRRPEVVALGVPFLVAVALGLLLARDPEVRASVALGRERVLQGDELAVALELSAARPVDRLEVYLDLPDGIVVAEGENPRTVRVSAGEPRTIGLRLRADRWGGYLLGRTLLRARDPLGLYLYDSEIEAEAALRVFPRPEELRALLRPRETRLHAGDELSGRKGEGVEFADVRPFAFGDAVRRVNWRASARRGELWVNEQHPERNMDIVLFLDSFAEARRGSTGTLDLAVRAAASLAARYVRRRARVGLVSFGGVLRWLQPGGGLGQLYRIVDALLDTEVSLNYAWKAIDVVPARTLPPGALVIALTPLIDDRGVRAILALHARGADLAVVELSPLPFVDPGPRETERIAFDLWRLRRDALREQLLAAGVAVSSWREGDPLAAPLQEVTAFRRRAVAARF